MRRKKDGWLGKSCLHRRISCIFCVPPILFSHILASIACHAMTRKLLNIRYHHRQAPSRYYTPWATITITTYLLVSEAKNTPSCIEETKNNNGRMRELSTMERILAAIAAGLRPFQSYNPHPCEPKKDGV